MRKLSCNMTTPTEETDSASFNKLIDITDVYTQAECGGKGHLQEKSVENSLKLKQHFFSPEKVEKTWSAKNELKSILKTVFFKSGKCPGRHPSPLKCVVFHTFF